MNDQHIPSGRQAVTPFICVLDFAEFLRFVQDGLGAEILAEQKDENGAVVLATIKIDDSVIHTMQAWDAESATPAMLYIYVADVAKAAERAIAAGGKASEGGENPFGDAQSVVEDKWNNFWWFARSSEGAA